MEIDIISFKDEQFAALTETQLIEVKEVQLQKNRLTERLAEEKRREKFRLLTAGIFRSPIYEKICEKLDARYLEEVEGLRTGLLFYLRFGKKQEVEGEETAPYPVDYSLSFEQRYTQVKSYYDRGYVDANKRFEEFKKDKFAPAYLGEYYTVLFDFYAIRATEA